MGNKGVSGLVALASAIFSGLPSRMSSLKGSKAGKLGREGGFLGSAQSLLPYFLLAGSSKTWVGVSNQPAVCKANFSGEIAEAIKAIGLSLTTLEATSPDEGINVPPTIRSRTVP